MQRSPIPFNVGLLDLTPQKLQGLKPVRVLDIFDGASGNFHEDGLFSVSIFGKVGDERRSLRFSFIDIKVSILHPIVYKTLTSLKRLYAGIMAGTEYAIWNPEIKDFERADPVKGETGYAFFIQHWKDIDHGDISKSVAREQNVLLLKKYGERALTNKVIVMPAGLRDVEILEDGRVQEDEINTLYRQILAIANTVSDAAVKTGPELLNTSRHSLQLKFNELYENIITRIEGKKKLLMGRWASRRIMNGTRNVITAMDTSTPYLGAAGQVGFNNTIVGLYQALKGLLPVSIYQLRHGFLSKVFLDPHQPARLVNKQTGKLEEVMLKPHYFDRWMTNEGLEKVITSFADSDIRHKPIEIEGRYLGMIYKGPDGTFKLLQDVDEVPAARSKADVKALTFCELLYLSVYHVINRYPVFVTRYPIAGVGSIYPSLTYVKTTIKGEVRRELNDAWEPMDAARTAYEFPILNDPFVNSLVPHSAKLARLVADFDGDTSSGNFTYSDESVMEITDFLSQKRAYVGTDGKLLSSTDVSTVALVLHNLTGEPA